MKRNLLISICAAAIDVFVSGAASAQWSLLSTTTPTPRSAHFAETIDGIIYTGQGASPGGSSNGRFDSYNPLTNTWQSLSSVGDLYGRASATYGGNIYAYGGVEHGGPLSTSNVFNPATGAWTSLPSMPTQRSAAAAAQWNGMHYVIGGSQVFGPNSGSSALERFDPATNSWTSLASMPTSRISPEAVAVNGRIYTFGGLTHVPPAFYNTVEVYDIATNSWSSRAPMPVALTEFSVEAYNDRILVVGGASSESSISSSFWLYDPNADSWQALDSMLTPRVSLATAIVGHTLYAIAGENSGYLSSIETYDLDRLAVAPIPEPETYAMLLAGLGVLGFAARRRKLKLVTA